MSKRKRRNFNQPKKQPQNLLDIIIPVYGKIDFLQKCLDRIPNAAGDISYHIYIHDNGTPHEEKSFYDEIRHDDTITIMQTSRPVGFPRACNMAARKGNSPLLFFLNDDVFLEANAISEITKEMDDPKTGVAGMKLLFPEDTPHGPAGKVQHVGIELNIRTDCYHQFIAWSPDNPRVLAKTDAMAVTGAALMTRRSLWNKIGGFSEDYGAGTYEDVEFCLRARDLGYNIKVCQTAIGYHWVSATAVAHGMGYPLMQNRNLFLSRMGNRLIYDEWRWL